MTLRFCRLTLVPAFLVGTALLSGPSAARADITLTLSEIGFASQTFTTPGNPATVSTGVISYGDFAFTADAATSAGSTPTQSELLTISLNVRNLVAGPKTLTVDVLQDGYTTPLRRRCS